MHLPIPDLTYIRNNEGNKIMFAPFHLLKTYTGIILYSLFPFSPSHLQGSNHDPRAHICAPGGEFCQISILPSWFTKLYECQIDLPNCWSCS
jgi:hypothetical protein